MRTNIHFKIKCSICGNELEADPDKSKFEYNNAYTAEAVMAIKPCNGCYKKAARPVRLLKQALSEIQ